jgi:hypothetical protein
MISKAELLAWVNTLSDDSCIGVDDGGLTLVGGNDIMGDAYLEVGGFPEDIENG